MRYAKPKGSRKSRWLGAAVVGLVALGVSASASAQDKKRGVITLAEELGYRVKEQDIPREALYAADELFFTGTAAEITPIRSVDKITIGSGRRGPVTAALQQAFFDYVNGVVPDTHNWLAPVQIPATASAASRR